MKSESLLKKLGLTSLFFRFMVVATLIVSIPLAIHTYLHLNDLFRLQKHIFEYRAETLSKDIDTQIRRKNLIHDTAALQSYIEQVKRENEDIKRINIYGREKGKYIVFASSSYTMRGQDADADDIEPLKTRRINIIEKTVDNNPFLEVQAPLYEKDIPVATVGLYLDLKQVKKEHHIQILLNTMVIVLVFLFSMLIFYIYLRRYLANPILSLQGAVQEVADGNLRIKAPIHHQDELGKITEAFNRMTEELRTTQEKLLSLGRTKAISQMAGAAAHELNQPLTTISVYGELLLRSLPEGDPRREQLDIIMAQTERMAKIVKMMSEITDYQTQSYLGDTRIIDLEKASKKKLDT